MAETIITTEFSSEMQQSYINYSMSVITARAVPDIRDGLKPVQRRVLFAMNELNLNSDKPHRKSARIVGDAMGKYHPHGDSSIYESLVVLSQDFKKGMALVDGHGNFGSIEGDGAAAMRYTEARLKKFTQEVYLADLDKEVVNFVPNFDETEKEPEVLPVRVPNILINGAEGIAVGMTTSVPTHNLAEVIDAMKLLIDNPSVTVSQLLQIIKGPDFPTGGLVINPKEFESIYETGKGKLKLRGKVEIEPAKRKTDRDKIIITEIPYTMIGANIGKFLNDVASLVETKKLPDIVDISNQSSKEGIKIVLELKKGANVDKCLAGLYKKTKLEDTFGVNMLAIVNGKPEILSLKRILEENLKFQIEINTRKYNTLLRKEQTKKEIQEGLIKAVDIIDLIIEIIRGSKSIKIAKECLVNGDTSQTTFKSKKSEQQAKKLSFTEPQATAILELRLSKLIGLEILSLQNDYKNTLKNIKDYEQLLGNKKAMLKRIKSDLDKIKKNYGLPRKTVIREEKEAVFEEELIVNQDIIVTFNRFGYVKSIDTMLYKKNEEIIKNDSKLVIECKNTSKLCIFSSKGNMYQLKAQDLPFCKLKDKGTPIENLTNFDGTKESIVYINLIDNIKDNLLIFVTKKSMVKKVQGNEFESIKKTIASTKLSEDDEVVSISIEPQKSKLKKDIVIVTNQKRYLRFAVDEITESKRISIGVRGTKLTENEEISNVYYGLDDESIPIKINDKKYSIAPTKKKKRDAALNKLR